MARPNVFAQIALENDDVVLPEGEDALDVVIEAPVDEAEIANVTGELEEFEDAIETSETAVDQLEEVAEFIEEKQEAGGMTEGEAQAITIATESIMSRFQGAITLKMPGLEGYKATNGRLTQSGYALESVQDKIVDVWRAIKAFVKKWIASAQNWFSAHFSAAGRLEKAGKALEAKANSKKGEVKESTITLPGSVARFLSVEGTGTTANSSVLDRMASDLYRTVNENVAKERLKAIRKAYSVIKVDDIEDKPGLTKTALEEALKNVSTIKGSFFGVSLETAAESDVHSKTERTAVIAGGKGIQVVTRYAPGENTNLTKHVTGITVGLYDTDESGKKFEDEVDMKTWERNEIAKAGRQIAAVGAAIRKAESVAKHDKAEADKAEAELDKISSKLAKKNKTDSTSYKLINNVIRNSSSVITGSLAANKVCISFAMDIARSFLSFGNKSLSEIRIAE